MIMINRKPNNDAFLVKIPKCRPYLKIYTFGVDHKLDHYPRIHRPSRHLNFSIKMTNEQDVI